MINQPLKDRVVRHLLPHVQTPAQYLGGELNAVLKDHPRVRGRLCLSFPDRYSIGMSHHGLQLLYSLMNRRDDWTCERVFAPWTDMEQQLRQHRVPLYSLETFTPLDQFDVLGFSLQYELGYTNVLTILDLAGIPLVADERTLGHPLVIAGGPCVFNPEPMARFIDLFVLGDGEETLPQVCHQWLRLKSSGGDRRELLTEMAARMPFAYVPQGYEPQTHDNPSIITPRATRPEVPGAIQPAVVADLDAVPLPSSPVVPYVECVHDRITIEVMRGCPWRCRFCQSNAIKRPLRFRRVDTIVEAAVESYRNTGFNEISLLSLSTSDYPHFDELLRRLQEIFRPLGVSISVPSLRVNEQLRTVSELLNTDRRSSLTVAPEAARDDLRRQIGKNVKTEDLVEGCRRAFQEGFRRVKLYFMCGLPGERPEDLDGIIDMAEQISQLCREETGRPATVVANVSNFVPKPHTPYQWHAMQRREYFIEAHRRLRARRRMRSVQVKYHDADTSLLEAVLCRGDRRTGEVIERAWRLGARFDGWTEQHRPELWQQALARAGIDLETTLHRPYPLDAPLPWDHIGTRRRRDFLEEEYKRSLEQLAAMQGE